MSVWRTPLIRAADAALWAQRALGSALKRRTRLLHAQINRKRSKAVFIIITGSSAKTTTAQLLTHILSGGHRVRSQTVYNSFANGLSLLHSLSPNDEFVVFEAGTDGVGQLDAMCRVYKPDVGIVTLVALEHYSSFRKLEAVAEEKATVIRCLPPNGIAILNYDDQNVRNMSASSRARVRFFGRTGGDYTASYVDVLPTGRIEVAISHAGKDIHIASRLIGEYSWLSIAAAASCALELGIAPEAVAERIASFEPARGRMTFHEVPNGPSFILDTVKAPAHSLALPLHALHRMQAARKIVVIGQISDYPGNPNPKYRDAYRLAQSVADEVLFVGPNAHRSKASDADIAAGRFRSFTSVKLLSDHLKATGRKGDVVLVKSAQNLHLERLLLAMTEDVQCWPDDCGRKIPCNVCTLYRRPFSEHGGKLRREKRFDSLRRRFKGLLDKREGADGRL